MASFKENLRNELDFQGLTVKELSARTGIIKGTLDNYLGVRASIPPADIAVKIADALNVSVEYLVTGQEKKSAKKPVPKALHETISDSEKALLKDLNRIPNQMRNTFKTLIHQTAEATNRVPSI